MPDAPPALPDVSELRLEEIVVQAPRPEPPTEAAIVERLALRAREATVFTPRSGPARAEDELVADLVLLDEKGRAPVPGGVLEAAHLWRGHPVLDPLHAALIGRAPGPLELRLTLDDEHPTLPGARLLVRGALREVLEARPPDLEDPAQLARLGYGDELYAVTRALGEELLEEAELDAAAAARELLFDALLARVPVDLDEAWVVAALDAAFDARERPLLERYAPDQLQAARAAFLAPGLARDIEARKLRVTLVLQALCARDGVALTADAVRFAVERVAEMMGVDEAEVRELVRAEPEVDHQVTNLAMQLVALHHVVERAQIQAPAARVSALGARLMSLKR